LALSSFNGLKMWGCQVERLFWDGEISDRCAGAWQICANQICAEPVCVYTWRWAVPVPLFFQQVLELPILIFWHELQPSNWFAYIMAGCFPMTAFTHLWLGNSTPGHISSWISAPSFWITFNVCSMPLYDIPWLAICKVFVSGPNCGSGAGARYGPHRTCCTGFYPRRNPPPACYLVGFASSRLNQQQIVSLQLCIWILIRSWYDLYTKDAVSGALSAPVFNL
jgi:hypothetical protein